MPAVGDRRAGGETCRPSWESTPLFLAPRFLHLRGHRGVTAGQGAGCSSGPAPLFPSAEELDLLEALSESNRQRITDNEQVGREADALRGMEKERAKHRHAEQAKQNQPQAQRTRREKSQKGQAIPTSEKKEKGRARDVVGKKVGTSGKTAEHAASCGLVRRYSSVDVPFRPQRIHHRSFAYESRAPLPHRAPIVFWSGERYATLKRNHTKLVPLYYQAMLGARRHPLF